MSTNADAAGSGEPDGAISGQPAVAPAVSSASAVSGALANGAVAVSTVDLTLSFGERVILSDITTDVRRGIVTALIGPTGSGKTTLLRTFNRMNDKVTGYRHSGDVLLDGRSIWQPGVELMALRGAIDASARQRLVGTDPINWLSFHGTRRVARGAQAQKDR